MIQSRSHSDSFVLQPLFEVGDVAIANRIDEICDRFESEWKLGRRPSISDFLDDSIGPNISALFAELVRIDIEYKSQNGEPTNYDEYSLQYPEFSDVITRLRSLGAYTDTVVQTPSAQPTYIGKYQLWKAIGRGGFGTVWKAWDQELARWVAIKVPRDQHLPPEQVASFLREAKTAAELNHPHIVPIIDSGVSPAGVPYIVSRCIDGISLRQWLDARKEEIGPREAAELAALLADAMEHARQLQVVHRDLKPGNVLIDGKGQPHITDFGLASRRLPDMTLAPTADVAGTPMYMSPEQVRGTEKLDHRSDVYSLGVLLYELLTASVPFRGDRSALFHQIVHCDPVPPRKRKKSIPVDLETICLKALAKEPNRRYQTAGELAEDLRRYLRGEPIHARRVSRAERAWRWVRRNPLAAGAAAVACVATTMAGIFGFQLQGAVPQPADNRRPVYLETEPAGARVVFYRLDERTGDPDPDRRTEAQGRSPVNVQLSPGEYFVVAALDDGRFHEVYRRVPEPIEQFPIGYPHLHTQRKRDDPATIEMPRIKIPELSVTEGMAFLKGADRFEMGDAKSPIMPSHVRAVDDFYIDPHELSVEQFLAHSLNGKVSIDLRYKPVPPEFATAIPFDAAVARAETMGKRLPMEQEYEYAATFGGTRAYPWGDDPPTQEQIASDGIGPVGTPEFDALPTDPPVYGLCTNVAEWTMTYASNPPAAVDLPRTLEVPLDWNIYRVVRGGWPPRADYSPRRRRFVSRYELNERLGLRCVRSAEPHLESEDFRQFRQQAAAN